MAHDTKKVKKKIKIITQRFLAISQSEGGISPLLWVKPEQTLSWRANSYNFSWRTEKIYLSYSSPGDLLLLWTGMVKPWDEELLFPTHCQPEHLGHIRQLPVKVTYKFCQQDLNGSQCKVYPSSSDQKRSGSVEWADGETGSKRR